MAIVSNFIVNGKTSREVAKSVLEAEYRVQLWTSRKNVKIFNFTDAQGRPKRYVQHTLPKGMVKMMAAEAAL